jgi:hypothetical protein
MRRVLRWAALSVWIGLSLSFCLFFGTTFFLATGVLGLLVDGVDEDSILVPLVYCGPYLTLAYYIALCWIGFRSGLWIGRSVISDTGQRDSARQ